MATTKTCSNCGKDIPADSRFCPACGVPQALACAACGHVNAANSRFCAQCGGKLGEAAAAAPVAAPAPAAVGRPAVSAERRQLTVMFCDLVGSTALSTRLDPEDLREVIAAYHRLAADVVTRLGGYVAQYLGDGVMVYFGYPEAHEDDAENAVRAALELADAMKERFVVHGRHQVRVGIATGLVVVGELAGAGDAQERKVVGETPNLAARLQSAAAPNSVVISATTRRLAGESFEYDAIEPARLKGFDDLVSAFRVVRERTTAGRFEALQAVSLTPLVGREEEMELLRRRWQQIKENEGRVVLLAGEAGIGKSRLTAALEESIKNEPHVCLRYFCEAHHQGSALQPIMGQLAHAAGFTRDDTPADKRAKLERLLAADDGGADIEPLAELLGLPVTRAADPADRDPQRKRRLVLAALIAQLEAVARQQPALMLFEDAHWADPTSVELLTLIIERLQTLPILLVITLRPDYQPPWAGLPHVTMVSLNRLSQRERAMLVGHVSGGKALPPELLQQIVERTDGVPLFVEELTKSVLESEELQAASGQNVGDQPAQPLAIPSTLQASLMARVDRLGSAREVLQIGAAIGREFSYEVLAAVAGLPDLVLQDALARLAEAELVFLRGTPPNAIYTFKHALIQDAAYSTMLRGRRQQLHSAIALVLEKRFPDAVKTTPEVVAQQFERAAQNEKAIKYWQQAADRDLRRFAMKESMAHYTNALRLALALPEGRQRDELELEVSLGLGLAQIIGIGPTSTEAAAHYRRALTLSRALPDRGRELFLATWGVWFHSAISGNWGEGSALADELVKIARERNDADLLVEAYHAMCPTLMWRPNSDLVAMHETGKEVIRLYDRQRHRDHAYFFGGHDSRVCARSFVALSRWGLGFPEQARREAWACIEDGRSLGHAFSHAHGLNMGSLTFLMLSDTDACRAVADELYPLAERNQFAWPLAQACFLRGWLAARESDDDGPIDQMLQVAKSAATAVLHPILLGLIAAHQIRTGRHAAAAITLERADEAVKDQARFYDSEIIRLRGENLLAQSRDNLAVADAAFRQAITLAEKHMCRALKLRAATSLAKLLGDTGRRTEGHALLAPVAGEFTEGFEIPDLRAAKALLAELN
ncbi:MAG TPA: adenylate/guanylate cyclase domain-containing protein [Xanthobacteraceae bacterium]|nr:adenylate/guanylate cyclase domain-containing protein [Xanthobacteraceae bacterium]